jgi:excisionase family DNA binding protein
MNREWMTAQDVADLLRVSVRTVNRWTRDGALPAFVQISRARRFRREEIERWLAAHEEKTRAQIPLSND